MFPIAIQEGHRTVLIENYSDYQLFLNDYPAWQRENSFWYAGLTTKMPVPNLE
jgi:hypothetical protein